MKRQVELSVDFSDREFGTLRSVSMNHTFVQMDLRVSQGQYESHGLDWEEWDALVAEVEHYRKLKAQSEAA